VADTIYSKKETSIGRIQRAADSGDDRANILIVDDRPDKLMALEATLASQGQNLILAHSGTKAGEITLRSSNPQTKWIRLEVIDNGIGIPPDALPRIFDPFEQVSGVGSGGLGLGLTICKAIVELHGGRISAFSGGVNHGANFVIELPTETRSCAEQSPSQTECTRCNLWLRIAAQEF
jgi:K+-sensing histidine kinase KdpD